MIYDLYIHSPDETDTLHRRVVESVELTSGKRFLLCVSGLSKMFTIEVDETPILTSADHMFRCDVKCVPDTPLTDEEFKIIGKSFQWRRPA